MPSRYPKVPQPPRRLDVFLRHWLKEVSKAMDALRQGADKILKYKDLHYILSGLGIQIQLYMLERLVDGRQHDVVEHWAGVIDLALDPESMYGQVHWINMLLEEMGRWRSDDSLFWRTLENIEQIDWAEVEDRITGYLPEPEYRAVADRLRALPAHGVKLMHRVEDLHDKLTILTKERAHRYRAYKGDGEDVRPAVVGTVLLYHATVNARQIMANGFLTTDAPVEGLGGSRTIGRRYDQQGISFTDDLYIATQIMRALKEAVLIARGELKRKDIERMAVSDGVADLTEQYYRSTYGKPDAKNWADPARVMDLFRSYLAANTAKHTLRYDPWFVTNSESLMSKLRTKTVRDVGVLACAVDTNNPHISYHYGMREWRVPPEAVVAIEELIT